MWTETLLPTHLEAIASCWKSALPVLQPSERLRLVTFLLQLQPHFPTWKGNFLLGLHKLPPVSDVEI